MYVKISYDFNQMKLDKLSRRSQRIFMLLNNNVFYLYRKYFHSLILTSEKNYMEQLFVIVKEEYINNLHPINF